MHQKRSKNGVLSYFDNYNVMWILKEARFMIAELRRPEGPPGAELHFYRTMNCFSYGHHG